MSYWNKLSLSEKTAMMKVAIQNGITNIKDIRDAYNSFAEGGNIYDGETEPTQQMQTMVNLYGDDYRMNPTKYVGVAPSGNMLLKDNEGNYHEGLMEVQYPELTVKPFKNDDGNYGEFTDEDLKKAWDNNDYRIAQQAKNMYPNGIYGSTIDTRKKVLDTDTELSAYIDKVADIYGINRDSIRYRLAKEGAVDEYIEKVNLMVQSIDDGVPMELDGVGLNYLYTPTSPWKGFGSFGLDDVGTLINEGKIKLRNNEILSTADNDNEKGREVLSAGGIDNATNIGLMAATLSYLKDEAKKYYPNATEQEIERYANIFYNRGISGGRKYIKNDQSDEYNVGLYANGGNLFESGGPKNSTKRGVVYKSLNGKVFKTAHEAAVENARFKKSNPELFSQKKADFRYNQALKMLDRKDWNELNKLSAHSVSTAWDAGNTRSEKNYPNAEGNFGRQLGSVDKAYSLTVNPEERRRIKVRDSKTKGIGFQDMYPNMIDSIGKYGKLAGVSPEVAFGLPFQETEFGRKLYTFNGYNTANENDLKFAAEHNMAIPMQNLVRDFEYNNPLDDHTNQPPLLHAFEYFKQGNYNRNDNKHTSDVKAKGAALLSSPEFMEMWKKSPYYYELPSKKHSLGGNLFYKGGYIPSQLIKDRIAKWEGKAMTQSTVDPLSGKVVPKNNSFESEAAGFMSVIPESIRGAVLSNSELADNLFSYSYNVGAHNFKKRVVPALERYFGGQGSAEDIANSMWASGDSKLRGLQKRRAEEKAGVLNALSSGTRQSIKLPMYDESIFEYKAPVINPEDIVVTPKEDYVYNPIQERRENLQRFSTIMQMMGMNNDSPYLNAINMASNPLMAIANMN